MVCHVSAWGRWDHRGVPMVLHDFVFLTGLFVSGYVQRSNATALLSGYCTGFCSGVLNFVSVAWAGRVMQYLSKAPEQVGGFFFRIVVK